MPPCARRSKPRRASKGWPALHAELARIDPPTAARLKPGDAQRIQRALEVFRITGQADVGAAGARAWPLRAVPLRADGAGSVRPRRAAPAHRQRFEAMLAEGLVEELARAAREICARTGHAVDALRRLPAGVGISRRRHTTAPQLREHGISATRQLAKRQLTWLRAMPELESVRLLRAGSGRTAAAVPRAAGPESRLKGRGAPPQQTGFSRSRRRIAQCRAQCGRCCAWASSPEQRKYRSRARGSAPASTAARGRAAGTLTRPRAIESAPAAA